MKFISQEVFSGYKPKPGEDEGDSEQDPGAAENPAAGAVAVIKENVGLLEKLHARYAPSRRMKGMFFEEHIRV